MPARRSADVGGAWSEFCRSLERATLATEADHLRLDDLDRAEGLRFLGRLARTALQVLDPLDSPARPKLAPITVTFGLPNPDALIQRCSVDPALEYRITGRRNSVHLLGFGAQAPGRAARLGTPSHLDHTQLELGPGGYFEIAVSARRQPGNWLQLTPEARSIMVRQMFLRRDEEEPAEAHIECLQAAGPQSSVSWDRVTRRLNIAAAQFNTLAALWPDWVGGFSEHADVNSFFMLDEAAYLAMGGDPRARTPLCRWRIGPDEALVVTLQPPRCDYWNIQLATIWTEPIEPIVGTSARNVTEVTPEPDGSVRVVVAANDPGGGNWLDTAGHQQGTMIVRWLNAEAHPMPDTEVVRLT